MNPARDYLDGTEERFAVDELIFEFDGSQVDLAAADDDADEGVVVGAQASHGGVETLGEVIGSVLDRPYCHRPMRMGHRKWDIENGTWKNEILKMGY